MRAARALALAVLARAVSASSSSWRQTGHVLCDLSHLTRQPSWKQWLHGICVDGERVWVTDSGMHMVHLLTTAPSGYAPAELPVG